VAISQTDAATPPAPQALEDLVTVDFEPDVKITHYGTRFSGRTLGCGDGTYTSEDVSIIAVPTARNKQWRCGMLMEVCGPNACIVGVRQDTCPGCETNHLDLTEQGLDLVCGPNQGVCRASLRVYATDCMIPEGIPATRESVPEPDKTRLLAAMLHHAPPERESLLHELSAGAKARSCAAHRESAPTP
jgi:hypothetical protein